MCRPKLYNRLTNGDKAHHHGILFAVLHSHNVWERLYEADPDREVVFTINDEHVQRILTRTIAIHDGGWYVAEVFVQFLNGMPIFTMIPEYGSSFYDSRSQ
jgi:hypothetical protein